MVLAVATAEAVSLAKSTSKLKYFKGISKPFTVSDSLTPLTTTADFGADRYIPEGFRKYRTPSQLENWSVSSRRSSVSSVSSANSIRSSASGPSGIQPLEPQIVEQRRGSISSVSSSASTASSVDFSRVGDASRQDFNWVPQGPARNPHPWRAGSSSFNQNIRPVLLSDDTVSPVTGLSPVGSIGESTKTPWYKKASKKLPSAAIGLGLTNLTLQINTRHRQQDAYQNAKSNVRASGTVVLGF